jgi:hypothetical protein
MSATDVGIDHLINPLKKKAPLPPPPPPAPRLAVKVQGSNLGFRETHLEDPRPRRKATTILFVILPGEGEGQAIYNTGRS